MSVAKKLLTRSTLSQVQRSSLFASAATQVPHPRVQQKYNQRLFHASPHIATSSSKHTPHVPPFKKLSDPLHFEDIHTQYPFPAESKIYQNLKTACDIVNRVREIIKESGTHPEANHYSREERDKLINKIAKLRNQMQASLTPGHVDYYKMILTTNPIKLICNPKKTLFEKMAAPFIKEKIGNCEEMTDIAYLHASKDHPAFMYHIVNGDHVFLVIGEGADAVICDPSNGDVFPFNEYRTKLKNCRMTQYRSSILSIIENIDLDEQSIEQYDLPPNLISRAKTDSITYMLLVTSLALLGLVVAEPRASASVTKP